MAMNPGMDSPQDEGIETDKEKPLL